MLAIGLDIGTTKICAIVIDTQTGDVIETLTDNNDTFIHTQNSWEKIQDSGLILAKACSLVDKLVIKYESISCIGITGQMHGIVYTNCQGNAVSPLYTWQDGRGDLLYIDNQTYAQYLTEKTGYKLATGFGITTHFYNTLHNLVPHDAKYFCTIHDYIAMKLTLETVPTINPTNAASFGLFDIINKCFDKKAFEAIFSDCIQLPEVVDGYKIVGETKDSIPVSIAIGDNQASFLGSVCDMDDCLLVNIGTGSQISISTAIYAAYPYVETRPCVEDRFLLAGSALCGGRAFAILEGFFKEVVQMATGEKCDSLYPSMDKHLSNLNNLENDLIISTKFSGTRDNPSEKGSITNLSVNNFTPHNLMLGTLKGMVQELYDMYLPVSLQIARHPTVLIGSGNGIRRNSILQQLFTNVFQMPIKIPVHKEEAAYGAALFALVGVECFEDMAQAQKIIRY